MWICSARTPTDRRAGEIPGRRTSGRWRATAAFTLVELILVLSFIGLLVLLAQTNLFGVLRRNSFRAQVQDFVSLMQMAASNAAETGRRYEMTVDPTEQSYLLREITSSDLSEVSDQEIIAQGSFGSNCRLSYVEFDDGDYANDRWTKFRVGRNGWTYGGKVVFLDEAEQPYTVIVSRLNPIVQLVTGNPPLMIPKAKDEVPFL